jgi:Rieske Fe-S protein
LETSSRREFLRTVVLTAASLVVIPQLARGDGSSTTYVDLGPDSQFDDGAWTKVVLPAAQNLEVIYVRKVSGQPTPYEALSARCTHHGCVVAWTGDQQQFVCPCHGGKFDITGANVSGPPKIPLFTLTNKVDSNNHLLVVPLSQAIITGLLSHHHASPPPSQ